MSDYFDFEDILEQFESPAYADRVIETNWGDDTSLPVRRRKQGKRLYQQVGEAWMEEEARSKPDVWEICSRARKVALHHRGLVKRASSDPDPVQRKKRQQYVQRIGERWINQRSNQIYPILDQYSNAELDQLLGCLKQVTQAVGRETEAFRRLKEAIGRRFGIPVP